MAELSVKAYASQAVLLSIFSVPLWGSRIHSHLHIPPQSLLHSTQEEFTACLSRAGFWLKVLVVVRGLVRVMSVAKIKGALGAVVRVRVFCRQEYQDVVRVGSKCTVLLRS